MKQKPKISSIFIVLAVLAVLAIRFIPVFAVDSPSISFVSPTPASGTGQTGMTLNAKVDMTEDDLKTFSWYWNGTAYSQYNNNLKLMMNFDNLGVLGENPITDEMEKTVDNVDVALDTSVTKFGSSSSMKFNGTSASLTATDLNDFDVSTSTFTVDFWVYALSNTGYQGLVYINNTGYQPFAILKRTGETDWRLHMSSNGSSFDIVSEQSLGEVTVGAWEHFALVREIIPGESNDKITVYRGGVSVFSTVYEGNLYVGDGKLVVGTYGYAWPFNGYIDEFRISKGIARWTETFTPPTEEYAVEEPPATVYTKLLLHGNLNNVVKDVSNSGNNGTSTGAVYNATGKYNGAYSFDGTDDYVQVPDSLALDLTGNFTLAAWVKPSYIGGNMSIFNKDAHFEGATGYGLFINGGGYPVLSVGTTYSYALSTVNENQWNHIAATYDGSNVRIYINGILNSTTPQTTNPIANVAPLLISKHPTLDNYYVSGLMDEPRIYDTALSTNGVSELYYSNLSKLGTDTWQYQIAQVADSVGTYTYKALATDQSDNPGDTGERTIGIDDTVPTISFVSPTPSSGITQLDTTLNAKVEATEANIKTFSWYWNDIAYTQYDSDLKVMMNFDNVTALGDVENSTVKDVSGNGNDGTVNNATYTSTGKYGGAYGFGGDGDSIQIADSEDVNFGTGDFTVGFWTKLEEGSINGLGIPVFISKVINWDNKIQFYLEGGALRFFVGSGGGYVAYYIAGWGYEYDRWYYLTLARNGGTMSIYVDGVPLSAWEHTAIGESSLPTLAVPLVVGSGLYGSVRGAMDELRIWKHGFTANEIQQFYAANLAKYDTDKWRLTVTESGLTEGQLYNYKALMTDIGDSSADTGVRTIRTDGTAPTVSFVNPTPNNGATQSVLTLNAKADITEANLKTLSWYWNGTAYSQYDDNLKLMMNFDNVAAIGDVENTTVKDVSNGGNNGTVSGATYTATGKYNGAYGFDETNGNDYVGIANESNFDIDVSSPLSISAWVYSTQYAAMFNTIFSKSMPDSPYTGYNFGFDNYFVDDPTDGKNYLIFNGVAGDLSHDVYVFSSTPIPLSQWTHVAVTYDGSSSYSGVELYINGVKETKRYYPGRSFPDASWLNDVVPTIGARGGASAIWPLTGSIDEVRFYNDVLTENEVKELYYSNLSKTGASTWQYQIAQVSASADTYTYKTTVTDLADTGATTGERSVIIGTSPPGNLTVNVTSTNQVILNFGSASAMAAENFAEYKIYYKVGASGVTTSDTAITSSNGDFNLGLINYGGVSSTNILRLNPSTQYVANIWVYNNLGVGTPAEQEVTFYTKANSSGGYYFYAAPAVSTSTTTSVKEVQPDLKIEEKPKLEEKKPKVEEEKPEIEKEPTKKPSAQTDLLSFTKNKSTYIPGDVLSFDCKYTNDGDEDVKTRIMVKILNPAGKLLRSLSYTDTLKSQNSFKKTIKANLTSGLGFGKYKIQMKVIDGSDINRILGEDSAEFTVQKKKAKK